MVIDSDVLIWAFRGNAKAVAALDQAHPRTISIVTYMELLRGARDKREIRIVKDYLAAMGFGVLPLTENIGHRASIYVEEYGLSASMDMADALIAATAVENHQTLLTGNVRHYRSVRELDLKTFRP